MPTMFWTNARGKKETREFHTAIDNIEKFKGTAGYVHLLIAANLHLSVAELERLLTVCGTEQDQRSRSWIQRHRWMYSGVNRTPGAKPNADGKDERAIALMLENPTLSLRALSKLLAKHGIRRGRDWVMRNRCG
jgi:hypothetical protein